MKQSPKLPPEKRRAQLIKAAGKVFTKKGYAGATTEEIARAAGLTKGALYFHFGSKEDVFYAVVRDISLVHARAVGEILAAEKNPEAAIKKILHTSFDHFKKRKYFTAEFWQQAHKIPRVRNFLALEHRHFQADVVDYLQTHTSLSRKKSESLILMLRAVFDGLIIRRSCYSNKMDANRVIDLAVEMAGDYIKDH